MVDLFLPIAWISLFSQLPCHTLPWTLLLPSSLPPFAAFYALLGFSFFTFHPQLAPSSAL
jgi:hypothetical protein